jgi:hypothetical protein
MNPVVTRTKYLGKQVVFGLPTPIGRVAVSAACAAGWLRLSYLTYYKLQTPSRILSGPFEGMGYVPIAAGSAWMPELWGTYESELHPTLAKLSRQPCDVLVDIGSAEGYYAVGLAKILGVPKVYGFDTDPSARELLLKNAALNGTSDRVEARGFCRPEDLEAILRDAAHPLVITDCEGGEVEVMDPVAAPMLKRCRLIIEVHDYYGDTAIGAKLRERFSASHEIEAIPTRPRTVDEFPTAAVNGLTDAEKLASLAEERPPVAGWLVLWPREE